MNQILTLRSGPRCRAVAAFFDRLAEIQGGSVPTVPGSADEALQHLASAGRLSYLPGEAAVEVFYVPSPDALRQILSAEACGFSEAIHKKQGAALRRSTGAIFRFPLEGEAAELEVFITDWSPSPAAAAVAIHRDHAFAADLEKPAGPVFTGRFVRHPLTGDVLPVWIADWVRPDFGTGAVLVNPAHDATDLAFARQVGLPLRFGLVPAGYDGSPSTWPEPPVVKTGTAIKTGICDGLPAAEAMARFFEILTERGLAERTEDVQAGRHALGRLVPDAGGELEWNGATRKLSRGAGGAAHRFEPDDLFAAALTLTAGSAPTVICPADAVDSELLFLRGLGFDLHGRPLEVASAVAVQKVQGSAEGLDPDVVRLAHLAGAPSGQVLVIKQKVSEQMASFLRVHAALAEVWNGSPTTGDNAGEMPKALKTAKAACLAGDPARALASLLQLQKQLKKAAATRSPALRGYFTLAHVLAGCEPPEGVSLRETWQEV